MHACYVPVATCIYNLALGKLSSNNYYLVIGEEELVSIDDRALGKHYG